VATSLDSMDLQSRDQQQERKSQVIVIVVSRNGRGGRRERKAQVSSLREGGDDASIESGPGEPGACNTKNDQHSSSRENCKSCIRKSTQVEVTLMDDAKTVGRLNGGE
jgi:hypothetical protein